MTGPSAPAAPARTRAGESRAAASPRRRGCLRVVVPWLLALAAVAACGWWMFRIPYDAQAIYRAIPARAAVTLRVLDLPERWEELVANPLVASALRTAGTEPEDALWLVRDPETRAWFDRLADREGLLAWLPAREGQPPALVAASWLGGRAPFLRQELLLFKLPDFQRMPTAFPDRAVWRVKGLDLPRGWSLALSFSDGLLLACLSPNPWAIGELLAAHDGTAPRLLDTVRSFASHAASDNRSVPVRAWSSGDFPPLLEPASTDPSDPAALPGRTLDFHCIDGRRMDLRAVVGDLAAWTDSAPQSDLAPLANLLGDAPCTVLALRRSLLSQALRRTWLRGDARHGVRMALEIVGDPLAVALLDGDFSGRLAFGVMRTLGLSGLKVPTLLLATPAPDPAAARAAVGRIMDSCNARYRGAFVFRPKVLPDGTELCTLESAGGNEWVDELASSDRPAWALRDGWLLLASNRAALEKVLSAPRVLSPDAARAPSALPAWAESAPQTPPTARLWIDLDRSATTFIHLVAMWSMAQRFLGVPADPAVQSVLDNLRAWLEAFRPYGFATATWSEASPSSPPLSALSITLGP